MLILSAGMLTCLEQKLCLLIVFRRDTSVIITILNILDINTPLFIFSSRNAFQNGNYNISSPLLSKNAKVRIYKNIILPMVLYGC
jgi:hypothetical protein